MNELLFVVTERSLAGDTLVGVYSSLELARAQLPSYESGRLFDFTVQAHVIDAPPQALPWTVMLTCYGEAYEVTPYIQCSGCPEPDHLAYHIDARDDSMHATVWALTPGEATAIAKDLHHNVTA
jgi:hypothetical protein